MGWRRRRALPARRSAARIRTHRSFRRRAPRRLRSSARRHRPAARTRSRRRALPFRSPSAGSSGPAGSAMRRCPLLSRSLFCHPANGGNLGLVAQIALQGDRCNACSVTREARAKSRRCTQALPSQPRAAIGFVGRYSRHSSPGAQRRRPFRRQRRPRQQAPNMRRAFRIGSRASESALAQQASTRPHWVSRSTTRSTCRA